MNLVTSLRSQLLICHMACTTWSRARLILCVLDLVMRFAWAVMLASFVVQTDCVLAPARQVAPSLGLHPVSLLLAARVRVMRTTRFV